MKHKLLFISQNPGGIGNRIRNMVAGMMAANNFGPYISLNDWRVLWCDAWRSCGEKNTSNKFTDLFDMAHYQATEKQIKLLEDEKKIFTIVKNWWWRTPRPWTDNPNNKLPKVNLKHWEEANKKWLGKGLDYLYDRTPQEIIEIITPYFEQIKFNPQIKKAADSFFNKNFSNKDIAVQIRAWKEPMSASRRCLLDINSIISTVNRYPNSKVYITSDAPELALTLKDAISNKVVMNDLDYNHDTNEYTGMRLDQRTWVKDMLILSKFKTLILPAWSTFGEMAFWLGGGKAKTVVI